MFRVIRGTVPLIFALCACAGFVGAQEGPEVFFGVGTAMAPSSNNLIDTFGTGNPFTTPRMGGTFGKFGADIMIKPSFGIGGEADFKFSQGSYAGLNYRPMFWDFNGIFAPSRFKRVVPELQAGLGGVNLKFYYSSAYCDQFAGCSTSNQFIESSNHFQFHLGGGIRFYVTHHIFIRPQVDAHWVNNFYQFGSSWVPEYTGSIGWSFGEH